MKRSILLLMGTFVLVGSVTARGVGVDEPRAYASASAAHGADSGFAEEAGIVTATAETHAGNEWSGTLPAMYDAMAKARVSGGKVKAYALHESPGEGGAASAEAIWLSKWRVVAVGVEPDTQIKLDFGVSFQGALELRNEGGDNFEASAEGFVDLWGAVDGSPSSRGTMFLRRPDAGSGPDPFEFGATGEWTGKATTDFGDSKGTATLNYAGTIPITVTTGGDLWVSMELRVSAQNPGGERTSLADFYNSGEFTFPTSGTITGTGTLLDGTSVPLGFQFIPEPRETMVIVGLALIGWTAVRRAKRSCD